MLTRESLDSRDPAAATRHGGLVPHAAVGDDAALWAAFATAATTEQFCLGWLTILCRLLPRARGVSAARGGARAVQGRRGLA